MSKIVLQWTDFGYHLKPSAFLDYVYELDVSQDNSAEEIGSIALSKKKFLYLNLKS